MLNLSKKICLPKWQLKRNFKEENSINGFLDDYASTTSAFIKLYTVSFDLNWIALANQITDHAIKNFHSKNTELFYYTHQMEQNLL